jgi:hypothetical protein
MDHFYFFVPDPTADCAGANLPPIRELIYGEQPVGLRFAVVSAASHVYWAS